MNEVRLSGTLSKEPVLKYTANGNAVCNASIRVPESGYHRLVAWRSLGERLAQLAEGDEIVVRGSLKQRSYTTTDGDKAYIVEVIMDKLLIIHEQEEEEGDPYQEEQEEEEQPKKRRQTLADGGTRKGGKKV